MRMRTKILVVVAMLAMLYVAAVVYDESTRTKYSYFVVESVPMGANVWVYDGGVRSFGGVTPCTISLEVGEDAVIRVEKTGYHAIKRSVYASGEYTNTETFVLQTDNPVDNFGRWLFG